MICVQITKLILTTPVDEIGIEKEVFEWQQINSTHQFKFIRIFSFQP
jgi:hypothetical protein